MHVSVLVAPDYPSYPGGQKQHGAGQAGRQSGEQLGTLYTNSMLSRECYGVGLGMN